MTSPLPDLDSLWDHARPADTEARFGELLPLVESGNDRSLLIELLTQLARAQGLQGRFDAAHATLDRAETLLADATPADAMPRPRARYLLERGRVFNSAGQPGCAMPLFEQALDLASRYGLDFYAVDAAHMLGIAAPTPRQQVDWNQRAIALAEASADPKARGWLASLYNNLGWTRFDSGDYAQSLELFRKAVPLREQAGEPGPLRIARYSVAKALRHLGRLDEALAELRAIEPGEPDGYIQEELGECLLALDRAAEAAPHFRRACQLLAKDDWLATHHPQRLQRIKKLSGT